MKANVEKRDIMSHKPAEINISRVMRRICLICSYCMSFLTCRGGETAGTRKLILLFGGLNYIEKLLLISGFRFLSRGML